MPNEVMSQKDIDKVKSINEQFLSLLIELMG